MASYLAIEIHAGNKSIADLNQTVLLGGSTKPLVVLNELIKLISSLQQGGTTGTVQLTSKDQTSTITTHGTGSTQISLTLT